MKITTKKIAELKEYEENPRIIEGSIEAVANSIKAFGFSVPIVIDKDGVIIAGHTRFAAAKRLGMKEVPCYVAEDLDEEKARLFRIVDNKVSELSIWDNSKLSEELLDLSGEIDMELFGFEAPRADLPAKTDNVSNVEFDAEDFGSETFAHTCKRCGFKWN